MFQNNVIIIQGQLKIIGTFWRYKRENTGTGLWDRVRSCAKWGWVVVTCKTGWVRE